MTAPRELIAELAALGPLREEEPLARHTTFGIGGPADAYFVASSPETLGRAVALCHRYQTPFFILGSGSNILVGDGGIRGVTIENRATQMEGPEPEDDGGIVQAGSGASLASLARGLARQGWAGLEWAAGIPGTVGGAVVYNAGAYGGCLADVLISVRIANSHGEKPVPAADLGLTYRGSAFTRGLLEGKAVLSASFRVLRSEASQLTQRVSELDRRRLAAQPRGRNAGSIFKNTPEHPAWWLIDQVGLRGHRIGDAAISPKHTNFFINAGHARAADVKALIDLARERVMARFGLELELEVALVGEGF
jgi:UDP-N-acetylmuramate dehydrogenase